MAKPRPKSKDIGKPVGISGYLPRIDSVSCAVPSVQTGDSIVIFGKNFSPHPFENLIVVSATPIMPPPPSDLVAEIGVGKASLNRLESSEKIPDLPAANYSVSVKVKGMYSNPVQVNFVLPQLSNLVPGVAQPWKPPQQQCPQAATTFGPTGNALAKGDKLLPGDFLISNNGRWRLDYNKGDGNLVLSNTKTSKHVFGADQAKKIQYPNAAPAYPPLYPFSNTDSELRSGNPNFVVSDLMIVHYCIMRDDGHLVMIQGVKEVGYVAGKAVPPVIDPYNGPSPWKSNNDDAPGAFFRVEDNGQICIYDANADDCVIWRHGLDVE